MYVQISSISCECCAKESRISCKQVQRLIYSKSYISLPSQCIAFTRLSCEHQNHTGNVYLGRMCGLCERACQGFSSSEIHLYIHVYIHCVCFSLAPPQYKRKWDPFGTLKSTVWLLIKCWCQWINPDLIRICVCLMTFSLNVVQETLCYCHNYRETILNYCDDNDGELWTTRALTNNVQHSVGSFHKYFNKIHQLFYECGSIHTKLYPVPANVSDMQVAH